MERNRESEHESKRPRMPLASLICLAQPIPRSAVEGWEASLRDITVLDLIGEEQVSPLPLTAVTVVGSNAKSAGRGRICL
jgi:hypothetical protein